VRTFQQLRLRSGKLTGKPAAKADRVRAHWLLVVFAGASGVDASAHRGALAADGLTVAVLAGGLSYGYPRGHADLAAVAAQGVVVSECHCRAGTR
jgi:predicted Rossmann fold nucleotide-binding protein DprA/Smf involved in DNA uptake